MTSGLSDRHRIPCRRWVTPLVAALGALALLNCDERPCPRGTTVVGSGPPQGSHFFCQKKDTQGSLLKHGPEKHWDESGQLLSVYHYWDGKRHGPWTAWHHNGIKFAEGTYDNGEAHGVHKQWSAGGQLSTEGQYYRGKKTGLWRHFEGQITSQVTMKDDLRDGIEHGTFASGKRQSETSWKRGRKSRERQWHENGNIALFELYEPDGFVGVQPKDRLMVSVEWLNDNSLKRFESYQYPNDEKTGLRAFWGGMFAEPGQPSCKQWRFGRDSDIPLQDCLAMLAALLDALKQQAPEIADALPPEIVKQ
jgi:hypothetical protein